MNRVLGPSCGLHHGIRMRSNATIATSVPTSVVGSYENLRHSKRGLEGFSSIPVTVSKRLPKNGQLSTIAPCPQWALASIEKEVFSPCHGDLEGLYFVWPEWAGWSLRSLIGEESPGSTGQGGG